MSPYLLCLKFCVSHLDTFSTKTVHISRNHWANTPKSVGPPKMWRSLIFVVSVACIHLLVNTYAITNMNS